MTRNVSSVPLRSRSNFSPSRAKVPRHLFRGNRYADNALRARHAHEQRLSLRQSGDCVHDRPRAAATDIQYQLRGPLDAGDVVVEVDTALEAMRSIAREVEAARAPRDGVGKEERRLEEDMTRNPDLPWYCPRP